MGAEYVQNHFRNLVNPPNNTYHTPNKFVLDILDSMEFFLPFQYLLKRGVFNGYPGLPSSRGRASTGQYRTI